MDCGWKTAREDRLNIDEANMSFAAESCEELPAARDEGGYVRSSSPPLSREMQTQEAVTADSLQDNICIFQLQVRLLLVTGPE